MDSCGGCLSEDLLIEILKRLPVESLVRFMCVSKPWSCLIKDPDFVTSHLQINKSSSSSSSSSVLDIVGGRDCFRYKQQEEVLEYFRIDNTEKTTSEHLKIRFPWRPKTSPKKIKPYISILGHCNGLVLAFTSENHSVYEPTRAMPNNVCIKRYIIFNPIARRFKILPESGIELPNLTYGDFSPTHTMSCFGLGFTDNLVYKVVKITYGIRYGDYVKAYEPARAEVYDSRTGRWREVSVNDDLSYEDLQRGVYNSFDRCLYWVGRGYEERRRYFTLVSFHLVDEIWYETLLPYKSRSVTPLRYDEDTQDNEEGVFGVYGVCDRVEVLGESVVMLVGDQRDELVWNVWKMNKEDDHKVSWTHMYGFDFEGLLKGFFRDGRLLLRKHGSLVLHDSRKMSDACFGFTDLDCDAYVVVVVGFVESLVLLDGESSAVGDPPEEKEAKKAKGFRGEDEDLEDLTGLLDEDHGDLTSLFDENL